MSTKLREGDEREEEFFKLSRSITLEHSISQ
jgi:hypothetical protein